MKRSVVIFCVMLIGYTMLSCNTTGNVWDDTTPPEQSAKIAFVNYEPTSYNGINVDKKQFRLVTLPAGTIDFSGDVNWSSQGYNVRYYFNAKDAVFSCRLEENEEYWAFVGYKPSDDKKSKIWGISLYKDTIKAKVGGPGDDKLVGFIPFNPPVISN